MAEGALGDGPLRGLLRWFLRTPVWLYRLRLGWLLGRRFLLLAHVGRKSGLARKTVLEVVRHDEVTGAYVVASGWGEKSNWLRNIQENPQVTITVGLRRLKANAVRLTPEGAEQELLDYARRYQRAFQILSSRFLRNPPKDTSEACRLAAKYIPLIAFHPVEKR